MIDRAGAAGARCRCRVELRLGHAAALGLPDQSVDMIFCHQTFHHAPDPPRAAREFYRVLRPGGVLLFSPSRAPRSSARCSCACSSVTRWTRRCRPRATCAPALNGLRVHRRQRVHAVPVVVAPGSRRLRVARAVQARPPSGNRPQPGGVQAAMTAPCAIGAVGVVSALGCGAEETWPRLVAADESGLSDRDDLVPGRRLIVGEVHATLPALPRPLHRYTCRTNQLALVALRQIEGPLREVMADTPTDRVAVVMGTSTSGIAAAEDGCRERARGVALVAGSPGAAQARRRGGFVADCLGARGPRLHSFHGLLVRREARSSARSLLELGLCDAVVAGAVDSLARSRCTALRAPPDRCGITVNPFSRARDGLTLGEGGAPVPVARERAASSCSAPANWSTRHHMSAPDPLRRGRGGRMRGDALTTPASPRRGRSPT